MAEITDVRIYESKFEGKQKAFASVTIDNEFAVHGIRVMENEKGLWISFPSKRDASGEFRDVFHPVTKEAREKIMKAVLDAYKNR